MAHQPGDLESVHFLDHEIQDNQVELLPREPGQRLLAAWRLMHFVALLLQVELKRPSEIGLVLNQENLRCAF